MGEWVDNEAFWATFGQYEFDQARWAAAPFEVEQVLALTGVERGASVLDMCCGVGRHSVEFAKRGLRVTGVDRNAAYLERARNLAEREGAEVEWAQSDMRAYRGAGRFDLVTNLWTSFGYFEKAADNLKALEAMRASLREGGALVLEVAGKEHVAKNFNPRFWIERDDGFLLQDRTIIDDWTRTEVRWVFVTGGEVRDYTVRVWLYSAGELKTLCREAGFTSAVAYGGLAGSDYDENAERLVVVART
jgi:SAM-dependent methyltransferase